MKDGDSPSDFQVPLYHGTSTLFLNGILEHGLGGWNPIQEWRVIEFARELLPHIHQHLGPDDALMQKICSFGLMANQVSAGLNYQHGNVYLSPSRSQAIGYTISKRWGSELLSYSLDFLDELVRRNVPEVCGGLYQRWKHIFALLEVHAAPLLVETRGLREADLLLERGDPVGDYLQGIIERHRAGTMNPHNVAGPCFRLRTVIPPSRLRLSLIGVHDAFKFDPEYSLFELPIQRPNRFRGIEGRPVDA